MLQIIRMNYLCKCVERSELRGSNLWDLVTEQSHNAPPIELSHYPIVL